MDSFEGRFQEALIDRLQKMIADEIDSILAGHLKYEEYIAKCGVVRTLQEILASMGDIRHALAHEATGQQSSPVLQRHKR